MKYTGGQVIGPGSVHPSGNPYRVVDNRELATITAEALRIALGDFLPLPEVDSASETAAAMPEKIFHLEELRMEGIIPLGGLIKHGNAYKGPCPWHGSETGHNFTIDTTKNVWYCFRHGSGGGPLQAIAVQEGIIGCDEAVRGGLKGDEFKKVLQVAKERYGLKLLSIPDEKKGPTDIRKNHTEAAARKLVNLAKQDDCTEFFHDRNRRAFARVQYEDHHEVMVIGESAFDEWLAGLAYDSDGLAPEDSVGKRASRTLAMLARRRGDQRTVFLRRGEHDGVLYYDLCNHKWQAVGITKSGWEVVDDPPARFIRYDHMLPQALPLRGRPGALDALVRLTNIGQDAQEMLKVQLVVSFVPGILQYGMLTLGAPNSSKTTNQALFVLTIDPSTDIENGFPKDENSLDLYLATHCLPSFDNISKLSRNQSDMLARAGTSGGSSQRELYSDNRMNSRHYTAQVCLNAIALEGANPDFLERNIVYNTLGSLVGYRWVGMG